MAFNDTIFRHLCDYERYEISLLYLYVPWFSLFFPVLSRNIITFFFRFLFRSHDVYEFIWIIVIAIWQLLKMEWAVSADRVSCSMFNVHSRAGICRYFQRKNRNFSHMARSCFWCQFFFCFSCTYNIPQKSKNPLSILFKTNKTKNHQTKTARTTTFSFLNFFHALFDRRLYGSTMCNCKYNREQHCIFFMLHAQKYTNTIYCNGILFLFTKIVANNLEKRRRRRWNRKLFPSIFEDIQWMKITTMFGIECNESCLNWTNIELHYSTFTIRGISRNTSFLLVIGKAKQQTHIPHRYDELNRIDLMS